MKKHFEDLLAWCKTKNIKVTFVNSSVLKDYAALNSTIAKKLGFKKIKDNEILIDKGMPEETQYKNLIHELVEQELLRDGEAYWPAHLKSLSAEQWPLKKAQKFVNKRKGKTPLKSVRINVSRSK